MGRKGERDRRKERRCGAAKPPPFMHHFTAFNYHNSCVKAGTENSAGQAAGQHSPYSIRNLNTHSPINPAAHVMIDSFEGG